ncbi:MAG TPA: triose-phosphate isomerase [Candidatus Binataceae bacterium]|jgi:triosephosphate isomerase|nr:triose-phosphate isomerase [Candidatus Binataceae bacterium]
MRKKLFAANWKMNLGPVQARDLIKALRAQLDPLLGSLSKDREVMIAPPAILIPAAVQELAGAAITLGAQNMHFEDQGAFTGEISAPMLKAYGVSYVILGHSERRHIFGETDELINKKVKTALRHGLLPLLCVGETLAQREAGDTTEVLTTQLLAGLEGLDAAQISNVTVAYEPVWAIGTGKTATPEQAQTDHGALRGTLIERAGRDLAHTVRILYGGSVTAENVDSLVSKPDIDGALVGGASLKANSFARIVRALTF